MASAALRLADYDDELTSAIADLSFSRFRQSYNAVSEFQWEPSVHRQLFSLLALEEGWDSYQAAKPSWETAMFTLRVLHEVMRPTLGVPGIVPTSEGGFQLEWHKGGCDLEINVSGVFQCDMWFENHRDSSDPVNKEISDDFSDVTTAIATILRQCN